MPDELEWRAVLRRVLRSTGRSWPFTTPLRPAALPPLSPRSRLRMGLAVLRLQRGGDDVAPFERMTARDWIVGAMGAEAYAKVWGPLLRGKFGDRADDISMAWLWGKLTHAPQAAGRGVARRSCSATRAARGSRCSPRCARAIEAGGGRVLIDRPVERLSRGGGSRSSPARPAPSAPATTRARSTRRRRRALRRRRRDRAQRRLRRAARARPRRRGREATSAACGGIEYHTALCLLLELDRGFSPLLLDQHRRPGAAVRRADRAHEPDRAARATAGAASSTSRTTSPPGHELLALDADALLDALRARAARASTRASTALGAARAGCTASPRRSRS